MANAVNDTIMKTTKQILYSIVFFMLSVNAFAQTTSSYYHYYKGEKVYLKLNTEYIYLSLEENFSEESLSASLGDAIELSRFGKDQSQTSLETDRGEVAGWKNQERYWAELKIVGHLSEQAYMDKMKQLNKMNSVTRAAPYFKAGKTDRIGLSNYFYVKLKDRKAMSQLYDLAKRYKAEVMGFNKFMPLWFTLRCTRETDYSAMELANLFYESGQFAAAEPDLMMDLDINCANDTYFGDQWGMANTGQDGGTAGVDFKVCNAWSITGGDSGVVVAVLDHGFEMNHPDLQANVFGTGYDTESGTSPSVVLGNHGTACAGIIGAIANNNTGVAGVAPGSRLMSVSNSLYVTSTASQKLADGINWAWQNGADVISNSWSHSLLVSTLIDDAISNALQYGRNGLGTIVVFSSGNDNTSVGYPANSNPDILAVGAVDRCGIRSGRIDIVPNSCDPWCVNCQPGSCFGPELDVVGPGTSVSTTDRQGVLGYNSNGSGDYNNGDYTNGFGGTSAACPFVAGVAALVLSANPNLTVQQVNMIIESSAQKIGGYAYANTTGRPNGTWHQEVGYGMVNAYQAVLHAQAFPCENNLTITHPIFSDVTVTYNANNSITATNVIHVGADVTYQAGTEIFLNQGFEAINGAVFFAYNGNGCGSGSSRKTSRTGGAGDDEQSVSLSGVSVENDSEKPISVYPNPFSHSTSFEYKVTEEAVPVEIAIYDVTGKKIRDLVNKTQHEKGVHEVYFEATNLPAGLYFYRARIGDYTEQNKIILSR